VNVENDKLNIENERYDLYDGATNTLLSMMYVTLLDKYKNECLIYTEEKKSVGIVFHHDYRDKVNIDINSLALDLKKCIEKEGKLFIIPFTFYEKSAAHSNMLIYRINEDKSHQIDHFEPHGNACYSGNEIDHHGINLKINKSMIKLKEMMEEILDVTVIYNPPSSVCLSIQGVQAIHQKKSIKNSWFGFCGIWSFIFAELIILAPNFSSMDVYDSFLAFTNKFVDVNDYEIMDLIVQGYLITLDERLRKYGKYGERYLILRYLITNEKKGHKDAKGQLKKLQKFWFDKLGIKNLRTFKYDEFLEKYGEETKEKQNGGKNRRINTSKKQNDTSKKKSTKKYSKKYSKK
jgi:hypothetical protein